MLEFFLRQHLFGSLRFICEPEGPRLTVAIAAVYQDSCARAMLTNQRLRFIDGDAGQPRRKGRLSTKSFEIGESPLKRTLHRISGILLVAKDAEGRPIGFDSVTLIKFSESVFES